MKKLLIILVVTFFVTTAFTQTYTFTGNGKWTQASNWSNNILPPETLPPGDSIIIDPIATGECILDTTENISPGATFQIRPGKQFVITYGLLLSADYPFVITDAIIAIRPDSATLGGVVVSNGGSPITARGFFYDTIPITSTSDSIGAANGTGAYSAILSGLLPNKTYYIKSFATNNAGTGFGDQRSFTTKPARGSTGGFVCGDSVTVIHTLADSSPVTKTLTYGTVKPDIGGNTVCWITKNLGADQQATSYNDDTEASAGWYWQFNRKQGYKHDGTTRTPDKAWIAAIKETSDWLAANDPCTALGAGWRIPLGGEWNNINLNWYGSNYAYQSVLKIHAAGTLGLTGTLSGRGGATALYWSSGQTNSTSGSAIAVSTTYNFMTVPNKAVGVALRCVNDPAAAIKATLTTTAPSNITSFSATIGGYITSGTSIIARGISYSKYPNPTIDSSTVSSASATTIFNVNLDGLAPNTTYYVRAYATNGGGTAYGNEMSFKTKSAFPSVTTTQITTIHSLGATASGYVISDGGEPVTARGFCYSAVSNSPNCDSSQAAGTGTGNFIGLLYLLPETKYYVRAYATNSLGTSYGNQLSFTTPPGQCYLNGDLTSIMIVQHFEGVVAPVTKRIPYHVIQTKITGESKCWITQNLGARNRAVSSSDTTEDAGGWYWQFNRKQGYARNGTTRIPGTWSNPGAEDADWNPANDPCTLLLGNSWRLPTAMEWSTVVGPPQNWGSSMDAFNSILKLHRAGVVNADGTFSTLSQPGMYWSNSQAANSTQNAWALFFHINRASVHDFNKNSGGSIRCLKD